MQDVQLRVLASGILFRACLRRLGRPTAEEKMELHRRVEEAAWSLSPALLVTLEGRDVDDGVPEGADWDALVQQLLAPATR